MSLLVILNGDGLEVRKAVYLLCYVLSFTVLLNGERGYYFLCAENICACLVSWQQT